MKNLKVFLFVFGFLSLSLNSFSQISAADLSLKVNKGTKKLEVFKKSDGSNLTAGLKLNNLQIDIFDKGGEYAGSLTLKDWSLPLDEFSPDEIVKVTVINMTVLSNNQVIELKDIRLEI
jgi:hypothetical protein